MNKQPYTEQKIMSGMILESLWDSVKDRQVSLKLEGVSDSPGSLIKWKFPSCRG